MSNELGQYKVWLYDRAKKKAKRLVKGEKKLNRIIDRSFPVLAWHPTGRALTWTSEKKGELYLTTYTLDDKVFTRKPVFMLEKVLSMAYSEDGQNMVFSGVREGRTDLYLYYTIGNRQEQLTDDQFDDLDPSFADNGNAILFSSDRTDDTLRANADVIWTHARKDIFRYDLRSRSNILARLTNTADADEREPMPYDSANYTYLSTAGNVNDRWLLHFDSAITAIDTTVHYRYFTTEALATHDDVGYEREVLVTEVEAGAAVAGHHFVGDEQDVVLAAGIGDHLPVLVAGGETRTRGTGEGLDDEAGDGGRVFLLDHLQHLLGVVPRHLRERQQQRLVALLASTVTGHSHRAGGHAVVAGVAAEHLPPAVAALGHLVGASQADGRVGALAAAAGEEHVVETLGQPVLHQFVA